MAKYVGSKTLLAALVSITKHVVPDVTPPTNTSICHEEEISNSVNMSACSTNTPSQPCRDPTMSKSHLAIREWETALLPTENKSGFKPQNRYGEKRVHIKGIHFIQLCLHIKCVDSITMKNDPSEHIIS